MTEDTTTTNETSIGNDSNTTGAITAEQPSEDDEGEWQLRPGEEWQLHFQHEPSGNNDEAAMWDFPVSATPDRDQPQQSEREHRERTSKQRFCGLWYCCDLREAVVAASRLGICGSVLALVSLIWLAPIFLWYNFDARYKIWVAFLLVVYIAQCCVGLNAKDPKILKLAIVLNGMALLYTLWASIAVWRTLKQLTIPYDDDDWADLGSYKRRSILEYCLFGLGYTIFHGIFCLYPLVGLTRRVRRNAANGGSIRSDAEREEEMTEIDDDESVVSSTPP